MTFRTSRVPQWRRALRGTCRLQHCRSLPIAILIALALNDLIAARASAQANQSTEPARPPLELQYKLRIVRPTTHLAEIEIDARLVNTPTLDFEMPVWSPGRYAIYDFAKNVQEFDPAGADGHGLAWTQPDKQTWRVETGGSPEVRVRYKVYGNDLSGSFSEIDSTHANLNGASIFMYVVGHKPDPVTLTVEPPSNWKIASGYSLDVNRHSFDAPNYDRLIDTPLEISPSLNVTSFTEHGKTFGVMVHDYATDPDERSALIRQMTDGVKKIVAAEMSMMPAPDFDHYTFLFHFAPDIPAGDGMEHLNSTQVIVSQLLSDDSLDEAFTDAAHEFFHAWNVKRLRPAALGPFDYTREDYSPSLWFAEGITSYYSYVAQLRAGLWKEDDFLQHLGGEIAQFETEPGRELMSAESSSFHAWFYDRSPQMQETNFANTTISYYNKGAILGMLLDLEIRARSGGLRSLDDVMRLLYQRFYDSPASTYYLPGRGYTEEDILQALNEVCGSDLTKIFSLAVQGTQPLPYAEILAKAGLSLNIGPANDAAPSLGAITRASATGIEMAAVTPGGPADRAGLSRGDLLVSADNFSLATAPLEDRLRIYPPGSEVPFVVQRHAERSIIMVKLDPPLRDRFTIVRSPDATPEQIALRKAWLATSR